MVRTFAVMYDYTPDKARQDAVRPDHLAHLKRLVDEGALIASGPWGADDARGGLLIFQANDHGAVQAIVDRDPFVTEGVVAACDIREWLPLLGPAAGAFAART